MGKDAAVVHQKRYFAPHLSQLTDSEQLVRVVRLVSRCALGVMLCARWHAGRWDGWGAKAGVSGLSRGRGIFGILPVKVALVRLSA